jgi:hypothetical protein
MARNVLSWSVAVKSGFEMRLYPYAFEEVPLGEYEAVLDFKVWAKKIMAIGCYFTHALSGKRFQLTVYCKGTGLYKIEGSTIDFTECPIKRKYRLKVDADQKKRIVFKSALLI